MCSRAYRIFEKAVDVLVWNTLINSVRERDEWWEFVILDEEPAPGPLTGREMRSPIPPVSVPLDVRFLSYTQRLSLSVMSRVKRLSPSTWRRAPLLSRRFLASPANTYRISALTLHVGLLVSPLHFLHWRKNSRSAFKLSCQIDKNT